MQKTRYIYEARLHAGLQSVYDGDTVRLDTDLGKGIWLFNEPHRLFGINAPEMRGAEKEQGRVSRDWLRKRLSDQELVVETIADGKGKYGRYLCIIWVGNVNVNREMVERGLAEENFYGDEIPDYWWN